ncbi:MAG: hypothetical protein ACE5HT_05380 [Gemmatimonadales bacterium]
MTYIALLAAAGMIAAAPVHADSSQNRVQATTTADVGVRSMEIDIWPEYDDPRVLVIYQGVLDSDVETPTDFVFLIPKGAQIHMAGALGEEGQHMHATFETRAVGDTITEVRYPLATKRFYMEFYYDPFDGSSKEFRYPLVSPFRISQLVVRVQEPLRASQFRTIPAPVNVVTDASGFSYNRLVFDSLPANVERSVEVAYIKPDRTPSVTVAGSAPVGGTAMRNILVVGVLALAGVVGYGLFVNAKSHQRQAPEGGQPVRQRSVSPVAKSKRKYKYCQECGGRMGRADNFCPVCGSPSTVAARS